MLKETIKGFRFPEQREENLCRPGRSNPRKKRNNMNRRIQQFGCVLAVSMLFSGCVATKKAEPAAQPETVKQTEAAPAAAKAPEAAAPKAVAPAPKAAAKPAPKPAVEPGDVDPDKLKPAALQLPGKGLPCDLYSVEVTTDKTQLGVGNTMSLNVEVKAKDFPLKGNEAHGIKVTFTGLGFAKDVPPSECLRAHPNGSLIIYNVEAANAGTYNVVANVAFYPTRDCVKSGVTKSSEPLTITVK